jgi:hypothetical protein
MQELAMMEPALPDVPPGYHFQPTHEELIRCYLNPWVTTAGQADFRGVVCAADVYAEGPDALTARFRRHAHGGNWYFLCVARWKDGGKDDKEVGKQRRMNRQVGGGGTWHSTSKRWPVGREGTWQLFEFLDAAGRKTEWIMNEYVTRLAAAAGGQGLRVLCKVHHSPMAANEASNDDRQRQVVVVGSSTKRRRGVVKKLLLGQNDAAGCSYAATAEVPGSSKRPRQLDDGEHGRLVACPLLMIPPLSHAVLSCDDYAGTSSYHLGAAAASTTNTGTSSYHLGVPAASTTTNSGPQSMMQEQGTGCHDSSVVVHGGGGVGAGDGQEPSAAPESLSTDYWLLNEAPDFESIDEAALGNGWMDVLTSHEENTSGLG